MKHAVDSSDGLKHAFGAHQQTHGAETSSPGGLGVTLRVEWKVGGGGRRRMRIHLETFFKVNEPEMVESLQTEGNLLGVSVL